MSGLTVLAPLSVEARAVRAGDRNDRTAWQFSYAKSGREGLVLFDRFCRHFEISNRGTAARIRELNRR